MSFGALFALPRGKKNKKGWDADMLNSSKPAKLDNVGGTAMLEGSHHKKD